MVQQTILIQNKNSMIFEIWSHIKHKINSLTRRETDDLFKDEKIFEKKLFFFKHKSLNEKILFLGNTSILADHFECW